MAGRRPKPTALKQLAGNPGRRPLNKLEPKYALGMPDPPESIQNDPVALKEWNRVVPLLIEQNVLTHADYGCMACYCGEYSLYMRAVEYIQEEGITIETPKGIRKNPAVSIASDAARQLRAFCAELGLTPSSRSKVSKAPRSQEADDKFEKFVTQGLPRPN